MTVSLLIPNVLTNDITQDVWDFITDSKNWENIFGAIAAIVTGGAAVFAGLKSRSSSKSAKESKQIAENLQDYKNQIKSLKEKVELLQEQLSSLRASHRILQDDYARAIEIMNEYQEQKEELQMTVLTLEKRIDSLENLLAEKTRNVTILSVENERLNDENAQLRQEVAQLKNKVIELKEIIAQLETGTIGTQLYLDL